MIAWMHGHNHTWEIVRKVGKLFVSCGRIGGFSPTHWPAKFGGGHLGGMYFEVASEHCRMRGYSVTEGRFFDELAGFEHLDARLETPTTFDAAAAPAFSYGYGGARDGQRTPVFNHVALAAASEEIVIGGAPGPGDQREPRADMQVRALDALVAHQGRAGVFLRSPNLGRGQGRSTAGTG